MIARLRGTLAGRDGNRGIVDVMGVGWEVHATGRALEQWAAAAGEVTLYVSTQVREDAIELFGFVDDVERKAFEVVMSVDGFGPRLALAALDALPVGDLQKAVETDDVRVLSRIPGVGAKKAQRLALELKGKLPVGGAVTPGGPPRPTRPAAPADSLPLALAQLEYGKSEIDRALAALAERGLGPDQPLEARLKAALQVLAVSR